MCAVKGYDVRFYPRDAMLCVRSSVSLSVHLSQAGTVPKQQNVESHKQCHVIAQGQSLVGDPLFHLKCAVKVTHPPPFRTPQF